jgi:hypothetical protein
MTRPNHDAVIRQACVRGLETCRKAFADNAGVPHTRILKAYIDAHDVVFGVYGDIADAYVIKGKGLLEQIAAGDRPVELRFGAVPCRDFEEAVAMSHVYGDIKRAN